MTRSDRQRPGQAFTLVELILVMALLATVMAFAAPSLSRSLRQRHLDGEAAHLLALTEYARDEAVAQGVPMILSIDPQEKRVSVEAHPGYGGAERRDRVAQLNRDIVLEVTKAASAPGSGHAVEFGPDGALKAGSLEAVRLADSSESTVTVARTRDGWGYEIVKTER